MNYLRALKICVPIFAPDKQPDFCGTSQSKRSYKPFPSCKKRKRSGAPLSNPRDHSQIPITINKLKFKNTKKHFRQSVYETDFFFVPTLQKNAN